MNMNGTKIKLILTAAVMLCSAGCAADTPAATPFDGIDIPAPVFADVSVHDPSVYRADGIYYIVGSHLASAKTNDFMQWEQISTSVAKGNRLVPDPFTEMKEALDWAQTSTFWAGDVQPMPDGRYYMYYCNCEGSKPLGCIGLAVSDNPDGPYEDKGVFLKSGMFGESEDGTVYDATKHPNCVDPHAFFDNAGQFWMVYGSYSGGIYILKMDPQTGLPQPGQGYGKKLLGANHSRIEGPYILYSPETKYYYMFLSFGGLDSNGGYNIRICRSKRPDGPYVDAKGQDMLECGGPKGSFFDDEAIEPYGVKLMGGFTLQRGDGESGKDVTYRSPGHNSAYYDENSGRYYLIFHTRFKSGEMHQVRVHEFYMNPGGWPVVSPQRYDGAPMYSFAPGRLAGTYKYVQHGDDVNKTPKLSRTLELLPDGSVTGSLTGTWKLGKDGFSAELKLDGVNYSGRFVRGYDDDSEQWVMSFTASSKDGLALWGVGRSL